ncbi:MAG: response regulator [Burkholderiaceae bacterium]
MNKNTIILMEDDEDLRELFRLSLEGAGYHVIDQANSRGINQLIEKHQPALIVTDMVMPDYEGMEGIFGIIDKFSVPIIAISGHADYLRVVEPLIASCLKKPITGPRLIEEVERVLQL